MNDAKPVDWRELVPVALLTFFWLAATAWARPLMLPDEGRYVGVAWEMLRSGDWLTPTLNGLPYFHKPPLFYWITAGSLGAFGLNEFAARAASLLAATAAALALYLFTRRWRDRRTAWTVLLVLLAQPLWTLGGQFANLDMLVAACISVAVLLFAQAALCVERGLPHRRALAAAYLMMALGVLAKGLIGAVLPALIVVLWLGVRRQWRTLLVLLWLPGVLLFLLACAPWFIAMQSRHEEFLHYFLVVQHFERFASGGFNNVMPFWFYPAVLALFTLPWWPWLPRVFRRGALDSIRGRSRVDSTPSGGLTRSGRFGGAQNELVQGALRLLMGVWLIVIVLFFSLPSSKLLGYVLPAVPPIAYLLAEGFATITAPSKRQTRLWWASAVVAGSVSIGAVVFLSLQPRESSRELAAALAAKRALHEPVFMLGQYEFDLPFYARLRQPVAVVDDWANPDIALHDNWRKELADASRFAPAAAAATLLQPEALAAALCVARNAWVIGPPSAAGTHAFLVRSREFANVGHSTLWMIDTELPDMARALGCETSGHGKSPS